MASLRFTTDVGQVKEFAPVRECTPHVPQFCCFLPSLCSTPGPSTQRTSRAPRCGKLEVCDILTPSELLYSRSCPVRASRYTSRFLPVAHRALLRVNAHFRIRLKHNETAVCSSKLTLTKFKYIYLISLFLVIREHILVFSSLILKLIF